MEFEFDDEGSGIGFYLVGMIPKSICEKLLGRPISKKKIVEISRRAFTMSVKPSLDDYCEVDIIPKKGHEKTIVEDFLKWARRRLNNKELRILSSSLKREDAFFVAINITPTLRKVAEIFDTTLEKFLEQKKLRIEIEEEIKEIVKVVLDSEPFPATLKLYFGGELKDLVQKLNRLKTLVGEHERIIKEMEEIAYELKSMMNRLVERLTSLSSDKFCDIEDDFDSLF